MGQYEMMRLVRVLLMGLFLTGVVAAQSSYVPERVFDSARHEFADFEMMLADLVKADVVFVGEEHDDLNTHRLELALLEGIARRRPGGVFVGLEMFERDVQDPLDHFQMGHLTEEEFLKASRPWKNYAKDYKPLVDFAIKAEWPVFASNVPRTIAAEVSKSGLAALNSKSGDDVKWFAKETQCPVGDGYFKRFAEAMGDHPESGSSSKKTPALGLQERDRYYQAQCLKDETMGESVAQAYATGATGGKRPLVVHFNGSFHSDYFQGTVERARRRLPGKRVDVITIVPIKSLDAVAPDKQERRRADYLVYTLGSGK
jgi:uncharacterized iron-regulated protein